MHEQTDKCLGVLFNLPVKPFMPISMNGLTGRYPGLFQFPAPSLCIPSSVTQDVY